MAIFGINLLNFWGVSVENQQGAEPDKAVSLSSLEVYSMYSEFVPGRTEHVRASDVVS